MRPSAPASITAKRADGVDVPAGRMAKVRGWRRRLAGPIALRTATLRIRVGSTSGCREVSLSKLPRGRRHTSLSRSAATLRVRWLCDSRDISPTMLPGGISAIRIGSSVLSSSS